MKPSVIDISHHQTINPGFEPARAEGIVGVIHKLTEGSSYVDDTVDARAFLAREAGLLFGVYHFVRPGDMRKQAEFFINTANKLSLDENGELLYALDHEDPEVSLDQAIEFLEAVQELTGKSPVIYSGHVLKEQLSKIDGDDQTAIYNYRLWLAQYAASPELPKGFECYWLWQYTDKGQMPGIAPAVDLNKYCGDRVEDLIDEWAGIDTPEPEPEPVPDMMYTTIITIVSDSPIGVNVRHEERK